PSAGPGEGPEGAGEDADPDGVLRLPVAVRGGAGARHHQHHGLLLGPSGPVSAAATETERDDSRARLDPWYPSLNGVVGAVIVLVGAYIGTDRLSDNSFFTHLATGRYILEHGFPHGDVYSFTAPGERWVVQSWL